LKSKESVDLLWFDVEAERGLVRGASGRALSIPGRGASVPRRGIATPDIIYLQTSHLSKVDASSPHHAGHTEHRRFGQL